MTQPIGTGTPDPCVDPRGKELPCRDGDAYWSNQKGCYISPYPGGANAFSPTDPIWQGNYPNGAIYICAVPGLLGNQLAFWAAAPPAGPAAPPDPAVLAQQALESMKLRAVQIGIVPENIPGSVGIIGFPTWMWAADPGESTTGPITRTASAAGYTVTATATLGRIVWNMGDGTSVTCQGAGTAYQDSYGRQSSPTCGHTYTRTGTYPVSATSYWDVTWEGIGQTGVIPLDVADATQITMGEVQVLSQ